jgi:hypothetical protein
MARLGQAKGSLLVHLHHFVVRKHGEAAWQDVLELLPPEDRKILGGILIMGGWYPIGVWNRALDRYLPAHFADPMKGMTELSEDIARKDLTTLYKLILKVGTPGFIIGKSGSLWGRYFDTATLVPKELGLGKWHLELAGPRLEDEAPSAYTCEAGVRGWLTSGLKLTGTKLSIVQTRCRFGGSPVCEYEASW